MNDRHLVIEVAEQTTTLIDYIHLNPVSAGLEEIKSIGSYQWCSLAQGIKQTPKKRPSWLDVSYGLKLLSYQDTASGRNQYLNCLKKRMEDPEGEKTEIEVGESLLKRWCIGSVDFRDKLLQKLNPKNKNDKASKYGKDWDEMKAKELIQLACEHFNRTEEELFRKVKGDLTRVAVAWAIGKYTTMRHAKIAEMTNLKSSVNVSHRTNKFGNANEKQLSKELRTWKIKICKLFT